MTNEFEYRCKTEAERPGVFYVWNQRSGSPTKTHPTFDAATKEAERLAVKNPGQKFLVMEARAEVGTEAPVVYIKRVKPEPPAPAHPWND